MCLEWNMDVLESNLTASPLLPVCINKMIPAKTKRSESRRSSILKPRKPRQPLQNVNFDSSSNENSPGSSRPKRRVSFAEKKHVKEFCHSIEKGTVWDNTYEEHDFTLKRSSDQNAESKENASLCASNNDYIHTFLESNSCHPNNTSLINNQLSQESVARADEDTDCDLDFNPVKSTELPQLGYAASLNKSFTSEDAASRGIVAYRDTDEEYNKKLPDEKFRPRQTIITNISRTSENVKSSNIIVYRDSYEENNVANEYCSQSWSNNVNSELEKSYVQDLSMELTAPIPAFLFSHVEEQEKQKRNDINNLDANTTDCNNVSMDIIETKSIFAQSVASDVKISEQISTMLRQNCENAKWDAADNTTDTNYANDAMVLTSIIQPFTDVAGTSVCRTNNTAFDTSMNQMIKAPSKTYEGNVCNENTVKGKDLRKDQTDKTEIFNDVLMEMTKPVGTILYSNVSNKENFRMDEPISKDDRTIFFHNLSMEMTKAMSTKNQEIAYTNTCESLSKKNAHDGKESGCFNEGTRILCKSMEFTEAVPGLLFNAAQSVSKNTCEDRNNDRTEFFNDASMEITRSINILPSYIDKENSKIDEMISENDKTTLFHNVSIEMTAVSLRNRNEITQSITCKPISKENTCGEKDMNNSTCLNEGTKLLCKSMEFTEVASISLPAENSVDVALQTDTVANKIVQDISMGITTATPSTSQLVQNVNEAESLIISKNEFQHPTTNNSLTKSNRGSTKENVAFSKEIVEMENIKHNELSNVVTRSSLDNLDHSSNSNFVSANGKKRMSDTNGRSYSKRARSSFTEVQTSRKNNVHSFPSANANYINDSNECFVENMNRTQDSNLRDSLNEINEHSFLKKSLPYLENSPVELQSIKPPSFVCLGSEEENSFCEIQHELQTSVFTGVSDVFTDVSDTFNRLIISNVTEAKCLNEEVINIDNQAKDCHRSTIDKIGDNQGTNCQMITTKTIINDSRSNESNCYMTKNTNEESIVSMNVNGKTLTVQDINHCASLIVKEIEVTDEDQVDERECIQERINEDAKLQNDIKEREQCLNEKRQEIEKCSDYLEGTGTVIENQIDTEEYRNLNAEVKQQSIGQKGECATKRLVTAQHISTIEDIKNEFLSKQDPFLILSQKLETHGAREDCIWNVYHKNIDKKMIAFGFMSNSLLIAIFLYDFNDSEENLIKEIKIISRISDDAGILIRITHKLIMEKINAEILTTLYRTHQDILPMLNFISQDVKLAMDFMFDLRRLDDLNLMEINYDEISFVSRSKRMDIILRVTIKIKQFDKLTSNDVSLHCLLGKIKETDIKNLIKNVKRDHKFLRRYMNDIKDYIDIMEETLK